MRAGRGGERPRGGLGPACAGPDGRRASVGAGGAGGGARDAARAAPPGEFGMRHAWRDERGPGARAVGRAGATAACFLVRQEGGAAGRGADYAARYVTGTKRAAQARKAAERPGGDGLGARGGLAGRDGEMF